MAQICAQNKSVALHHTLSLDINWYNQHSQCENQPIALSVVSLPRRRDTATIATIPNHHCRRRNTIATAHPRPPPPPQTPQPPPHHHPSSQAASALRTHADSSLLHLAACIPLSMPLAFLVVYAHTRRFACGVTSFHRPSLAQCMLPSCDLFPLRDHTSSLQPASSACMHLIFAHAG